MHNLRSRISKFQTYIFNYTVTIFFTIWIISKLYDRSNISQERDPKFFRIAIKNNLHPRIIFNPNLDLTEYFHLNIKQIFVWLEIEHIKNKKIFTEMIWWRIVKNSDESLKNLNLNLKNIWDYDNNIEGDITCRFKGCFFPYVGQIRYYTFYEKTIKMKF